MRDTLRRKTSPICRVSIVRFTVAIFLCGLSFGSSFAQSFKVAPSPHSTSDDGLHRNENGKILFAVPNGTIDDGSRVENRSVLGKRIYALKLEEIERLYLMSDQKDLEVTLIVSDETAGNKVLAAAMPLLYESLIDSDLNQGTIVVYHGESWVPSGKKLGGKEVQEKKYGPLVAATRCKIWRELEKGKNELSDESVKGGKNDLTPPREVTSETR